MLVDARKGVIEQTRRHAAVAALLGRAPRRARGQQDGPRRLVRGGLRPHRGRLRLLRLAGRARRGVGAADERAARRQRGRELLAAGLVRGAAAARAPRDGRAARGRARRAALPGPVGAARPLRRRARLRGPRRGRRAAARAPRSSRCPRACARAWSRSRRSTGRWRPRRPGQSVSVRIDRELDLGRGDMLVAAESAPVPARALAGRRLLALRGAAAPRRAAGAEARHRDRARGRRRGARPARPHDLGARAGARRPRAQRHRPRAPARLAPAARRALRGQPRHRRVRPHRRGRRTTPSARGWSRSAALCGPVDDRRRT